MYVANHHKLCRGVYHSYAFIISFFFLFKNLKQATGFGVGSNILLLIRGYLFGYKYAQSGANIAVADHKFRLEAFLASGN